MVSISFHVLVLLLIINTFQQHQPTQKYFHLFYTQQFIPHKHDKGKITCSILFLYNK